MEEPATTVSKRFWGAFILDEEKLRRIDAIIRRTYESLGTTPVIRFEVESKKGTVQELGGVEEVLKLDNTKTDPITAVVVTAFSPNTPQGPSASIGFYGEPYFGLTQLMVSDLISRRAQDFFRVLEDQVQRTRASTFVNDFKSSLGSQRDGRLLLTFMMGLVMGLFFAAVVLMPSQAERMAVQSVNTKPIASLEDKVDFLYQLEIERIRRQFEPVLVKLAPALNWENILIALFLLFMCGCATYAITKCYPTAVFKWGDCKELYEWQVLVRRWCWNLFFVSGVMAFVVNLVSSLLSQKIVR